MRGRKRTPMIDRFMANIEPVTETGCWLWTGDTMGKGYGRISVGGRHGKKVAAHRYSYEHFVGPLGDSLALHKCDVRCCVNPDHIYAGSYKDNLRDALDRGRMPADMGASNRKRYKGRFI